MGFHSTFLEYLSGNTILDIGFAQLPNSLIQGKNLHGIDIQEVDKPSNYSKVQFINLNKENIPYSDNYFDTVILAETIEHVENPSQVLRECNRVLINNGRFIISTPQANYFFTFLRNLLYSFTNIAKDNDPGEHLSNWTMLDLRRLLRKNGFEIEKLIGGYIYLPYVTIPVSAFPIFGWQVIYICSKKREASDMIFTKSSYDEEIKTISNT